MDITTLQVPSVRTFVNPFYNIFAMSDRSTTRPQCGLLIGAAAVDVTPQVPTFLYGYPHVPRISTGVHDPLLASAMFISDGRQSVLFVSVDIIWLSKSLVAMARSRIEESTSLAAHCVMITATHTHSGPVTLEMASNLDDKVVPAPDSEHLELLVDGIVTAATEAYHRAELAELACVIARCPEIGGNRHDRLGPTVDEIPVVAARSAADSSRWLALMYVNRVHPTVLHEDSTLISGDFPGLCRTYLQSELLGGDCPVLCHLGAAGNQSPRHVTLANDYAEARRLGELLGDRIKWGLEAAVFRKDWQFAVESTTLPLPVRTMPELSEAMELLELLTHKFEQLRNSGASRAIIRTAECAVFGGEEIVRLARAAECDELRLIAQKCLPAEIQIAWLGQFQFVGWPGEVFAEFALLVRERNPNAFIITLANGELQGYLVTEAAINENVYEASNAVFSSPASGEALVKQTLAMLTSAKIRNSRGL